MAQLYTKIKLYTNQEVDFLKDVILQDDGNGAYIKEWNLAIAEPTDAQLDNYESAGNAEEANNIIIATRKTAYGSWDKQLEEIYDNGIDSWKTRIAKVKTDNPKE